MCEINRAVTDDLADPDTGLHHGLEDQVDHKSTTDASRMEEKAPVLRRGTISCEGAILRAPPDVLGIVVNRLVMRGKSGDSRLGAGAGGSSSSSNLLSESSTPAVMVDDGLRDAARLGSTCRIWRDAYRALLLQNVGLSIEVTRECDAILACLLDRRVLMAFHHPYSGRRLSASIGSKKTPDSKANSELSREAHQERGMYMQYRVENG